MQIKSSDLEAIKPFVEKLYIPAKDSHKGQNGKVLIVGGSQLFHAASLWAAEIISHFTDMVHFASTENNNEIFQHLKKIYRNGIVVPREELDWYAKEDDAILIGPGLVRGEIEPKNEIRNSKLETNDNNHTHQTTNYSLPTTNLPQILTSTNEAEVTYGLTHHLLSNFPEKKFVLDAGALQMMEIEWLKELKHPAILTPHQLEFETLFGINVSDEPMEKKIEIVKKTAKEINAIILLKAVSDIITDGENVYIVEGGNQGLTKGGSGDILAGLTTALYAKNDPLTSAVLASYVEKTAADELYATYGYWYNMLQLIEKIPTIFRKIAL